MSLSSISNRISLLGNAVLTTFSYDYLLLLATDMQVYLDGVLQTSGYTVDPVGLGNPNGGNITFTSAPASGVVVLFLRVVPLTQLVDYVEGDKFPAETHEEALDRLTMQNQQQDETIGRSITWPLTTETTTGNTLPDPALAENQGKALFVANDGLSIEAREIAATDTVAIGTIKGDLIGFDTDHARIPVGSNEQVLTVDDAQPSGVKWTLPPDYRDNPITNGAMQIAQRASSVVAIGSGVQVLDNYAVEYASTSAVFDCSQSTTVPTEAESGAAIDKSLLLTSTTPDATVDAGMFTAYVHRIEGYKARPLKNGNFTVSFWIFPTAAGTYTLSLRNNGSDRSLVKEFTLTAGSWQQVSLYIEPFDITVVGGNWGSFDESLGLSLTWVFACGTTFQTTADVWQTGNFLGTSNSSNAFDTISFQIYLTGVQIDRGAVMKPYRMQALSDDLHDCQRYFQKSYNFSVAPGSPSSMQGQGVFNPASTSFYVTREFSQEMRVPPTMEFYQPIAGTAGSWWDASASVARVAAADSVGSRTWSVNLAGCVIGNIMTGHWSADASLGATGGPVGPV